MSQDKQAAYITGGASGIGLAVAQWLAGKGFTIIIADQNLSAAEVAITSLPKQNQKHLAVEVQVTSWSSQETAFRKAIEHVQTHGIRIRHVYAIAGIGEQFFLPPPPPPASALAGESAESAKQIFTSPNLQVLDVDLNGVIYTISLAVQYFRTLAPLPSSHVRNQSSNASTSQGSKGRIATVSSICGHYAVPTLPIYTAAKHAVTGFVRSYGKYLMTEGMTLNAVAPNVVRTGISKAPGFYDMLEEKGLLTSMEGVIGAFQWFAESGVSGEIVEVGPLQKGDFVTREALEYLDAETEVVCEKLRQRGLVLQTGLTERSE